MEKCSQCEHMKKENKQLRLNRDEAVKNLVEVVNENLALRRDLEKLEKSIKNRDDYDRWKI